MHEDGTEFQRLLELARNGDKDAFAALVAPYRARLVGFARTLLNPDILQRESGEDVAQNVLLAVWRGFGTFRGTTPAELEDYLLQAVKNAARNAGRDHHAGKRCVSRQRPLGDPLIRERADHRPSPSAPLRRAETKAQLDAAIAALPEAERRAFELRYVDQRKTEDIAEVLGVSRRAVGRLLDRAVARLRDRLPPDSTHPKPSS
jgi:RNA polymerase sigma-70 factor (ECF subfamily)